MYQLACLLISASALIIFILGTAHLIITFRGSKLHPRDLDVMVKMKEVSPRITRETTMWKAWIGFNASHSYGALLYGAVYIYLALAHPSVLVNSLFLLFLGISLLCAYLFLAKRYWFNPPFRGILLATLLYTAALISLCF